MQLSHICVLLLQLLVVCTILLACSCTVSATGNRYAQAANSEHHYHHNTHQQQQQQQQQPQQQSYSSHSKAHSSPDSVPSAATISAQQQQQQQQQHHAAPTAAGSGQHHLEKRSSYNLLSEAMSQAVSNEFSSLGSGFAEGSCHADDLDCYGGNIQDRLGMEAIRTLHRQLDDDDNGNIDLSESDDFLREELKYNSGYEKRQKAFHFNDDMHISVKELWEAWLRSEVHNWTIEQTTDWLAQSVQLPQYVELFKQHKVTGAALPRLAVNNMHYVSNVLGIKDPIHKQKISLKAMDVVLFGPPRETGTRWKDYILVTLVLSVIIGCWYGYQLNKNSKRHLRRLAQDLEGLQRAEQSLQEMQKELERSRMEQENVATEKMNLERRLKEAPALTSSSSDLEVQQLKKEIEILRTELSRAEIELVDNCWSPPPQLQTWLQYTYELETKNHQKKRISAEKQLQSAREACEKLRKKRSSLVGAFVSTHGKSTDDVDRSIVEARNALGEVTNELQERMHRWKQIESCLGFNIVNNNGLAYLESILYGRNGGSSAGSTSSTKGSRARIANSTDDLDDDSVQGLLDSYTRAGVGVGISSNSIGNLLGGGGGSTGSTIHEDSSGNDDGNDNQSVTFYLGPLPNQTTTTTEQRPTTTVAATSAMPARFVPSLTVMDPDGSQMNSGSNLHTASAPILGTPLLAASGSTKSNHMSFCGNDSFHGDNFIDRVDGGRESPSISSERLISVPPRAKKQMLSATNVTSAQPQPQPQPSSAATANSSNVRCTPLPPPRKSNQSPMLRSHSSDLMLADIYKYIGVDAGAVGTVTGGSTTPTATTTTTTGGGATNAGHTSTSRFGIDMIATMIGRSKKMVKQKSTASQQSTSSTSSSAHSAPPSAQTPQHQRNKYSPARWSAHEQQSMHNLFSAQELLPSRAFSEYVDLATASNPVETAPICWTIVDHCNEARRQQHTMNSATYEGNFKNSTDANLATDAETGTGTETVVKKRKRRLRLPFGGIGSSGRNNSNESGKSKIT